MEKKNPIFQYHNFEIYLLIFKKALSGTHKEIHKRRVNQAKGQQIHTQTPLSRNSGKKKRLGKRNGINRQTENGRDCGERGNFWGDWQVNSSN